MPPLAPLELLRLQAEGSFDGAGRLIGLDGLTIVCTGEDQVLWIGAEVPAPLATELAAVFDGAAPVVNPTVPPPALAPCWRRLDPGGGRLQCRAGPSFLFPDELPSQAEVEIVRSDAASPEPVLRQANPGNWQPVEWDELLEGRLGPWSMALEDGRVVSICHTPGAVRAHGAECGVWTAPAFRGRGYASATAAAWAAIIRSPGRHLFYSTDSDNLSSQRVARRLHLRPLGWTWRLGPPPGPDDDAGHLHPLCSLRRPP